MLVSDRELTVLVDGAGNCIEIESGVVAIGSGGLYAQAAAQALLEVDGMDAVVIAKKAMKIAGDLCVYTNHETMMEVIESVIKSGEKKVDDKSTEEKGMKDKEDKTEEKKEMRDEKMF